MDGRARAGELTVADPRRARQERLAALAAPGSLAAQPPEAPRSTDAAAERGVVPTATGQAVRLTIAEVRIDVGVGDTAFRARLAAAFRGFATPDAVAGPDATATIELDDEPAIWRDESAEPRAAEGGGALVVEHRDFVARLAADGSRIAVLQPRRILSTENALRVLLALALARRGGLLLHAAGVARPAGATVLFGRSGSGKSTSARLARGRPVLGDDLVALTRDAAGWRAHSTPFGGASARRRTRRSAPLRSLLRLRHGAAFELRRMAPAAGAAELLQSTVLPAAAEPERRRAFEACADLAEAPGVRELRFPVDHGLWRWLGERGV